MERSQNWFRVGKVTWIKSINYQGEAVPGLWANGVYWMLLLLFCKCYAAVEWCHVWLLCVTELFSNRNNVYVWCVCVCVVCLWAMDPTTLLPFSLCFQMFLLNCTPSLFLDHIHHLHSMEDLTDPEMVRVDPKCDRTVSLYGYLRGTYLKNKGQVHIPGKYAHWVKSK